MTAALIAAILGATALWVLSPLLGWARSEEDPIDAATEEQEHLLATRRQLLASIKDLDMEHRVGKLTAEDHEATREKLTLEAVEVLRRLDEKKGTTPQAAGSKSEDR